MPRSAMAGSGRLAACFLDSFAELGLPSFGYGLRYRYGMFAQRIHDGQQVEQPDDWMRDGNPWEVQRPELRYPVGFGGRVQVEGDRRSWLPAERLIAEAYDFIVPAHRGERVSTLRQWHASADTTIDFGAFCRGDHAAAARESLAADALNWVLYPDDSTPAGRELRLKAGSLSRQRLAAGPDRAPSRRTRDAGHARPAQRDPPERHPPGPRPGRADAALVDDHGIGWDAAWAITCDAVSYTNHTLMPEALETWPLALFGALLPRHLEIVYEINARFLADVRDVSPATKRWWRASR
jgi:starch phosphorylase